MALRLALYTLTISSLIAWTLQSAVAAPDSLSRPTQHIEIGSTTSASHSADEQTHYELRASAGRRYLIEVEQFGVDLILSIVVPGGQTREFNSPLHRKESDIVLLDLIEAGTIEITLRSDEFIDTPVGHSITITDVTEQQESRNQKAQLAWHAFTLGAELNQRANEASWGVAIEKYRKAANLWREINETRLEARARHSIAMIQYWGLWNYDAVVEESLAAETLYRSAGMRALAVDAARLRATALMEIGLKNKEPGHATSLAAAHDVIIEAILILEESRKFHEAEGNLYDVGQIINNIGLAYFYLGDWSAAERYWQESMLIFSALGERSAELLSLNNLAIIDGELGHFSKAIEKFERILDLIPPGRAKSTRGFALINLAAEHKGLGNFNEALKFYSLAIDETPVEQVIYRSAISGLGETYYGAGQFDLSERHFDQALQLARRFNDGRLEVHILHYLGNIEFLSDEYGAALKHHSLALDLATAAPQRVRLKVLIANDLTGAGAFERALKVSESAVQEAQRMKSDKILAEAYSALGNALHHKNELEAARGVLNSSMALYKKIGLAVGEADSLRLLAQNAGAQGDYERATNYGARAIDLIENLRGKVADPELRGFFLARKQDFYDLQIGLLMDAYQQPGISQADYLERALQTAEQARARVTADLIAESASGSSTNTDPTLIERRRASLERLAELRHHRNRLLNQPDQNNADQLQTTLRELAAVEHEINLIDTQMRQTAESHGHLMTRSSTADEMQNSLDDQTALIQYSLGKSRSYAWVVTRQSILAIDLPPEPEIEVTARVALEMLRKPTNSREEREQLAAALDALSAKILQPVLPHVKHSKVRIAPDGALHYIPFGLLPALNGQRLVDLATVTHIPSSTVLAAIDRSRLGSERPFTVALFADPVFEPDDARLERTAADSGTENRPVVTRIPWTEREAALIEDLTPPENRLVVRGFDANRERFLSHDLSGYRILHLATHGIIDSRYPELSTLVLSLYDRAGKPIDGVVRLPDIYGLNLSADLVVLSACDTALGRELRGEGLMGFMQGFFYAGSRNLLTSLWRIPDQATAELMARFYEFLLTKDLSPADALGAAQREMAATRRWRDPYFWGAFVLVGSGS